MKIFAEFDKSTALPAMILTKVTATGANDATSARELALLHSKFPYAEFGILLSSAVQSSERFPSFEWINQLPAGLSLAGHLCDSYVREVLRGNWPEELREFRKQRRFRRWQLNTHGREHSYDVEGLAKLVSELARDGQGLIFQYDGANAEMVETFAGVTNCFALHDLSHGAGALPANWPGPVRGMPSGYAGGLSPANLAEQLGKLETVVGNTDIWIDAETHLRSLNDEVFEIAKVEKFLETARPWTRFISTAA